jgi:hypothetical protein
VHDAALRPQLAKYLRPGERRYCVGIATNLRQSRLLLDAARVIVRASPLLSSLLQGETDEELHFPGATIIALPATARGIRGLAVSSVVFDEMAHMLDADSNQAAEPLWRALVPATAQFGDESRIVACSTPWGTGGVFHELYAKAESGELEDGHAEHATTAQANPTIGPDFLRREFERDPTAYAGEYEARFVESGGAFIDSQRIAECVGRSGLGRLDILDPILGVDLGFTSDPAACVVVGKDTESRDRLAVARCFKWEPQKSRSFEERRHAEDALLGNICEVAFAYAYDPARACPVVLDQHLSAPVSSYFRKRGVPVKVLGLNATTKSLAFEELRARIHGRSIELPDDHELLAELRGLRAQFKAGSSSVVTPRTSRGHSDLAVACALATYECRHVGVSEQYAAFHRAGRWDAQEGTLADEYLRVTEGLTRDMRL